MDSVDTPVCARVRLRADSLARVREWAAHLAAHRDQALKSLEVEGVSIESVFLESTEQGDFLIYYMRAASIETAQRVALASISEIDRYHRAFKRETWAGVEKLELLVDLRRG
ncbi:DUF6176 family protein [Xylophilus sp. GW821-FHT01B05]